jgi:hypothetical protein
MCARDRIANIIGHPGVHVAYVFMCKRQIAVRRAEVDGDKPDGFVRIEQEDVDHAVTIEICEPHGGWDDRLTRLEFQRLTRGATRQLDLVGVEIKVVQESVAIHISHDARQIVTRAKAGVRVGD